VDGELLQGTNGLSNYGSVYLTNVWTNYSVQGTIQFSATNGAYGGGLTGRLNPATGARYAAWVYPEGSPATGSGPPLLKLIKFQNWTGWSYQGTQYNPIASTTLSSVGTNWHTCQMSFEGTNITVSFDGTQVLNAGDGESTTYTNGTVGVDLYVGTSAYTFSANGITATLNP
jgi:hypothetical protein